MSTIARHRLENPWRSLWARASSLSGLIGRIADFLWPSSPAQSAVGGDPAIHGVEPAESDIWMDIRDRVGHTLVQGTTRVCKTRLAKAPPRRVWLSWTAVMLSTQIRIANRSAFLPWKSFLCRQH